MIDVNEYLPVAHMKGGHDIGRLNFQICSWKKTDTCFDKKGGQDYSMTDLFIGPTNGKININC